MTINKGLAVLFATGSLFVAGTTAPAQAASVMTEAFLANIRPNVDFLDRSSRLALTHSSSARLRTFAHDEAMEQTITANSIVAWSQANTTPGAVGAVVVPGQILPGQILPSVVPTTVGLATLPLAVGDVVLTGRSVAVDVPVAITAQPDASHDLLPAGQTDLDRLLGRHGRSFDVLYKATQSDALHQLQTLYSGYVQNGDDPDLRMMALSEIPKINHRLAELGSL